MTVTTNGRDIPLVLHATSFAAYKHRDQRRKDHAASPYINHPISLAYVLAKEAGIEDGVVLAAALLHDTIEDTDTTFAELEAEFGPEIASVVLEVTDDKLLPKLERKRLQIEHAATISAKAKLVKLADKISNLRDITASPPADWTMERKREYFDWAKQVVDQVRGVNAKLESLFDLEYSKKPE
jgi:guanosine-3',5'-bis(diphosphate) 3'-pyrophosphohydrolase